MTHQERIAEVKAAIPRAILSGNAKRQLWGEYASDEPCPACDGTYQVYAPLCIICHGEGRVIAMLATEFVRIWAVKYQRRAQGVYRALVAD